MNSFVVYLIILAAVSLVTLIVFAADKRQSKSEANGRIPEAVMLTLITFGGAVGGLVGIYGLRHKTNFKTKYHFAITVWLSFILQIGIAAMLLFAAK